jgi:hypothetical protein
MTVEQRDDGWFVVEDARVIGGPFVTNAQAWRWIDRNAGLPVSRSESVADWFFHKDLTRL